MSNKKSLDKKYIPNYKNIMNNITNNKLQDLDMLSE